MGSTFIHLAGVQFESEFRAKYITRACKQFAICLNICPDNHFQIEIERESTRMQKFITVKIKERTDDLEVLQQIFEVLQDSLPAVLTDLKEFVGEELFEIYYKLAIEVDASTGEKATALKYLNLCQQQSLRMKGKEDTMVQVKIDEIKKALRKRDKDQKLKKAGESESKGDLLVSKGLYIKAANKYKKAIEFSKDRCAEAEALAQFKLGRLYFEKMNDIMNARIHLVDFQLLTFVVKVRSDDISKNFQHARFMMQKINKQLRDMNKKAKPKGT